MCSAEGRLHDRVKTISSGANSFGLFATHEQEQWNDSYSTRTGRLSTMRYTERRANTVICMSVATLKVVSCGYDLEKVNPPRTNFGFDEGVSGAGTGWPARASIEY